MQTERTIEFYIEKAKEHSGISSDRQLGPVLGMSTAAISQFKTGRALPSDDSMVRLAELAGVDPYIALIDLNSWRSEGAARNAYKEILKRISVVFIAALILFPANKSSANVNGEYCHNGSLLYIMENNI